MLFSKLIFTDRHYFRPGLILGLFVGAVLILSGCTPGGDVLPTRVPTAVVSMAGSAVETAEPTPTAPPQPAAISLASPLAGTQIDLGQSVEIVANGTHPLGIRAINLSSNGSGIGTYQAVEQTSLDISQPWTPTYGGFHHVTATLIGRDGSILTTETVTVRVVDRQLLAQYAPIFADIEKSVTAMRGLAPLEPVVPSLLSETELRQRLQAGFFFTEEEAERDVLVLYAFDFTPRTFDLYNLTYRYLGENITGFYDPTTNEFVVVSNDKEIDALEKLTYAHEFMHALQDQHFSLGLITAANTGYESGMALRALAEGEATFVQAFFLENNFLNQAELVDIYNTLINIRPQNNPDYFPPVLSHGFSFAYTTGAEFAATLYYEANGWEGLNNAWRNLPQSTEQIIHPNRYLAGDTPLEVIIPPLSETLGSEWTQIEEAVFGEFFLREYLSQQLIFDEYDGAATGWGGDLFTVYWHEPSDEIVLVLRNVWDTAADSSEFTTAYQTYADRRFGTQRLPQANGGTCWQAIDVVCLSQVGSQTLVVRGPTLEVATAVSAEVLQ